MSIFKCKMCGGTLEIANNETVAVCEYCGTKQTLPKLDDEKRANLYDRANHFRRSNEYDKAMGIYEQILNEDSTDAEAYWSLVLCRYGIEYVEDPATHKRVPTVNRAQYASIYTDEDYKAALQYADGYQKVVYEEEAQAIDEIQKGILAISQREEPFDVFICYKETDNQGRRTPDSVLANDLYHQLTQEGFRVFFARITLEDKLGSAYEPYIFAALNSAKVMVVLGTKPEHFNAVWVKNEWSRYLSLIKNDSKKMLIPAYKDMDPYDLPEEFSHLQAQDMSKLGFMQDLIRGIKKITAVENAKPAAKETVVVSSTGGNAEALLKRAFMFLEDGDFASANEYCEKVLDLDPENARGYLGKLMAQQKVKTKESLRDCAESFEEENNYLKAVRFGDAALVAELQGYVKFINDRNELARKTAIYNSGNELMEKATTESDFKEAAEKFQMIPGFEESDSLAEECLEKAEVARKDAIYNMAQVQMKKDTISGYEKAVEGFQSIIEWKDAEEQSIICQQKLRELNIEHERKSKKIKKWIKIFVPIVIICTIAWITTTKAIIPYMAYKESVEIYGEEFCKKVYNASIGNTITFGNYEQDGNIENGGEDIEWIVLEKDKMSVFLISKYALDTIPYNDRLESVTWENSSIRTWLNEKFLNEAFTKEETDIIKEVDVSNLSNDEETSIENNIFDKVFLLSVSDVEKYMGTNEMRKCMLTTNVIENTGVSDCSWWLREAGNNSVYIETIESSGAINNLKSRVNRIDIGVRPAIWIDLSK